MESKAARRYLRQVKLCLFCDRARRQVLLSRAQAILEEFLEEHPQAAYRDILNAFGTPKSFAGDMLEDMDPAEMERVKKRKKLLWRGVAATVALTLIGLSLIWYHKFRLSQDINDNDVIVIVEHPVEILTDEEFQEILEKDAQAAP